MSTVISAKNICFHYRVLSNQQTSIKTLFRDFLARKVRIEKHEVLKNLSFQVERGEVLAIIGNNGAGKSTLLKLIARVVAPTHGHLEVLGNIAPMIQLGAGFHPELTGRENIIFYSALLGRDISKVKYRVDEIAKWAGVYTHLDYQLRTYSTGMVARLAFATATDEVPDVLLIDEVLSVGDADFSHKSKNRMNEIIKSGSTVVLVSHDLKTVAELADRVILLKDGKIFLDGEPTKVISAYQNIRS